MLSKRRQLELVTTHQYAALSAALGQSSGKIKKRGLQNQLTITLQDLILYLKINGLPDYELGHHTADGRYYVSEEGLWKIYWCANNEVLPGSIFFFSSYENMLTFVARHHYIYLNKEAEKSKHQLGKRQIKFLGETGAQSFTLYSTSLYYPGTLVSSQVSGMPEQRIPLLSYKRAEQTNHNSLKLEDYNGDVFYVHTKLKDPASFFATAIARVGTTNPFRRLMLKQKREIPIAEQLEAIITDQLHQLSVKYRFEFDHRFEYITATLLDIEKHLEIFHLEGDIDSGYRWKHWRLSKVSREDAIWSLYRTAEEEPIPGSLLHFESKSAALNFMVESDFAPSLSLPTNPIDEELGQLQQSFEHPTDDDYFVELYQQGDADLGTIYFLNDDQDVSIALDTVDILQLFELDQEGDAGLQLHTQDDQSLVISQDINQFHLLRATIESRLRLTGSVRILRNEKKPLSAIFHNDILAFENIREQYVADVARLYQRIGKRSLDLTIRDFIPNAQNDLIDLLEAFILDEALHHFYVEELAFFPEYQNLLILKASPEERLIRLTTRRPIPFQRPASWADRKLEDLSEMARRIGGNETIVLLTIEE